MADWMERNRSNLAAALVVLVVVATAVVLQMPRRSALQVSSPSASLPTPQIKVHVIGAVISPGVYQLSADARAEDAVKAAGGASAAADMRSFNLAAPLKDGQQLQLPEAVASPPHAPDAPSSGAAISLPLPSPSPYPPEKVELNSASRAELESLPGIGPVTAQRILERRAALGRISSVEELKEAKIINSATYEKIRGLVEVK